MADARQNAILIAVEQLDGVGGDLARQTAHPSELIAEIQRGGRGPGVRAVAEHLHLNDVEVIEAADIRAGDFEKLDAHDRAVLSMGFADGFFAAFKLIELRGWDIEALQKPRVESEAP